MIIPEPPDGFTTEERMFLKDVIHSMYLFLGNDTERFIIMAVYEAQHTQDEVARMLGVSQPFINRKLKEALARLKANQKVIYTDQ
jgi:DNA-directed RNA polymerase specialized sigma subunit